MAWGPCGGLFPPQAVGAAGAIYLGPKQRGGGTRAHKGQGRGMFGKLGDELGSELGHEIGSHLGDNYICNSIFLICISLVVHLTCVCLL
ncbi:hypothetical protein CDAR_612171 [Caerostris darwini]|uniref:Uncharacterized protein n=1 Tax=Caerostris darwini TaxID=1538125 RepID=A0AAV4S2V2_9ARAC|nr:hypothetical protein CDAR_612171 [Caerostris darwini]